MNFFSGYRWRRPSSSIFLFVDPILCDNLAINYQSIKIDSSQSYIFSMQRQKEQGDHEKKSQTREIAILCIHLDEKNWRRTNTTTADSSPVFLPSKKEQESDQNTFGGTNLDRWYPQPRSLAWWRRRPSASEQRARRLSAQCSIRRRLHVGRGAAMAWVQPPVRSDRAPT